MCSSYLHTCREMSSHCVLGITYGSIFCLVSRRVMERTCFEPCDSHDNVQPHRVSLVTAIHDETAADGRLDVSNKPRHNTTQIAQRQQQKTPDLLKLRFSILCTWAPAPGGDVRQQPAAGRRARSTTSRSPFGSSQHAFIPNLWYRRQPQRSTPQLCDVSHPGFYGRSAHRMRLGFRRGSSGPNGNRG